MHKEKLIDLLKSDEKIKTEMGKKCYGYIIEVEEGFIEKVFMYEDEAEEYIENNYDIGYSRVKEFKIIGLPLQERFIKMYCENTKKIRVDFFQEYVLVSNVFTKEKSQLIELDNTKDFDNQDDIVYQKLYEAIYNLNK